MNQPNFRELVYSSEPDSKCPGGQGSAPPVRQASYQTWHLLPPAGVERRLYRILANQKNVSQNNFSTQTSEQAPLIEIPIPARHGYGDPSQNITRGKVLELLARQIDISFSLNYPLSILLMEFVSTHAERSSIPEPMTRAIGKLFLAKLRATDLVLRFGKRTIMAVLPEADNKGVVVVSARLKEAVGRFIQSIETSGDIMPAFGVSGHLAGYAVTEEELLVAAEQALDRSKAFALNRQPQASAKA